MEYNLKARDLQIGDSIDVPGVMLHDDLAGLLCTLTVNDLRYLENKKIEVYDKYSDSWTWFYKEEELKVYRPVTS